MAMAKLTRNGIAHDLSVSPYRHIISYDDEELTLVFSSKLHQQKFIKRMLENRQKISSSLSNRFGFLINTDVLADLTLYISIESRGFLLYAEGEKITCLEDLRLDGDKVTKNV